MISQGQFFDKQLYDSPEARQPRPNKAPSTRALFEQYINTGSVPDGVEGRRARAMANRARVGLNRGGVMREHGTEVDTRDFGLEQRRGHWGADWLPATYSEHEWRKFGHTEEVPYTQIRAGQGAVVKERVLDIQKHPGVARDPRYSGAAVQELPHAVKEINYGGGDAYTLHQGHHRIVADMTNTQPQLFHQLRVVNRPKTVGEQQLAESDLHAYRAERAARMGVDLDEAPWL